MKKKLELFYFFRINEPKSWKNKTHNDVVPRITSTLDLLSTSHSRQTGRTEVYLCSTLTSLLNAARLFTVVAAPLRFRA